MNLNFQVVNAELLQEAFSKVERGLLDLRQLGTWNRVQSEFYKVQKEIFASEGSAARGGKWKALTPTYAAVKSKRWGQKPILQASGDMYKEFTTDGKNVEKTALEMVFTFSPPAGFHMSKEPRSKMPYRSSLDMTDEQQRRIFAPIGSSLRQLIDNAKLRDIRGF